MKFVYTIHRIIKFFLLGRSMKVVVNCQSTEVYGIDTGFSVFILGLLYINTPSWNILRSLVNIWWYHNLWAHIQRCRWTDLCQLSSNLILTAQWRRNWLVTLSITKTKQVTFHLQCSEAEFSPVLMKGCTLYWDLSSLQTKSRTHIYDSSPSETERNS